MANRLDAILSIALTVSGLAIASVLVRREFFSPRVVDGRTENAPPTFQRDWQKLLGEGIASGPTEAPVKVVEFTDLECPFCKQFHAALRGAQVRFPRQIQHVFIHYPLASHRFARPAARAAECANNQGRFSQFIDAVFAKQDSLGLKSWVSYGREAGLSDTLQFAACTLDTAQVLRIEAGLARGEAVGVSGTPTVIVNGWRFAGTPSDSQLSRFVRDIVSGKQPPG